MVRSGFADFRRIRATGQGEYYRSIRRIPTAPGHL